MGQIVKTKKKGRPSKADLAARAAAAAAGEEDDQHQRDFRRSLRRRSNVRYSILDYDEDYLDDDEEFNDAEDQEREKDEDEEDEDEGERRREKKLKFVLKLPSSNHHHHGHQRRGRGRPSRSGGDSAPWNRRVVHRPTVNSEEDDEGGAEESEEIEEREESSVKRRKISDGNGDGEIDCYEDEDNEGKGKKEESKRGDSIPGTPDDTPSSTHMPEKKQLELLLDKLQKKDTYGVYAEPVDPEELPDYHDIIEHPMDFGTVRKKLANESYAILEDFESDVFLICSNAMQYNPTETIYHKQARAIKELAERKFQHVRFHIEQSLKEPKTEEKIPKAEDKIRPTPIVKKQVKKPIQSTQEPVGSDFSGATFANANVNAASNVVQDGSSERPSYNDGHVGGIFSLVDNSVEKVEDISGKGLHLKVGKKSVVVDEYRRATYDISNQPVDRSDSIFTTFENEKKQLIPVGVAGEHSYARSLARFAATLGPVAWGIASQRIEQALPRGFRYDRGWVVEYEPISTSELVLKSCIQNDQPLVTKVQTVAGTGTNDNLLNTLCFADGHSGNGHGPDGLFGPGMSKPSTPTDNRAESDGKSCSLFGSEGSRPTMPSNDNGPRSDRKPCSVVGTGGSKPPTPSSGNVPRAGGKSSLFGSGGSKHPRPTNDKGLLSDGQSSSLFCSGGAISTDDNKLRLDGNPSNFTGSGEGESSTPGAFMQQFNPFSRSASKTEDKIIKTVVSSSSLMPSLETNHVRQNQIPSGSEMHTSQPVETDMKNNSFLHRLPSKQPDTNGAVPGGLPNGKFMNSMPYKQPDMNGPVPGGLPNGKFMNPMPFKQPDMNGPVPEGLPNRKFMNPMPFKQPDTNRAVPGGLSNGNFMNPMPFKQPDTNGAVPEGLPNGKFMNSIGSPASKVPLQAVGSTCVSQRPDQGLSDPVQVMRMLTEKAQKQQNGSNLSFGPGPSVPSPREVNTGNATTAGASAWMSIRDGGFTVASDNASNHRSQISADSLYSASREYHAPILQPKSEISASRNMHLRSEKSLPFQAFVSQDRVSYEAHVPNKPPFFPQPVTVNSPRFQTQSSPWRGLSPRTQHRQKQDNLPPDLNIAFQSSVDSQQPDLALQL